MFPVSIFIYKILDIYFMATFPQDDLTQHFLYSYQHEKKIGPTDEMKRLFINDLIFDLSRKTIFTQGQEFGYVGNIETRICTGKFDDYCDSYMSVISYEGNIRAYEYVPLHITGVKLNSHNFVDNMIVMGTELNLSNITFELTGSKYYHYTDNAYTAPKERPISLAGMQVSITDSLGKETTLYYTNNPEVSTKDFSILPIDRQFRNITQKYIANLPGELKINITCWDDVTYADNRHNITLSYTVANYVTLSLSNATSSPTLTTFKNISNYVQNLTQPGNAGPTVGLNGSSRLTNDWGGDTVNHPYKIETLNTSVGTESQKVNTYVFLHVPQRLQDDDIIYGNLNNGTVQEFKKIATSDYSSFIKMWGFGNGQSYVEPYNLYLSTARNWVGMKLSFDTRN